MQKQLEGKITRFSANPVNDTITFMLEGDNTIYVLKTENNKYLPREVLEVLALTQPGDEVSISFYPRTQNQHDGDLTLLKNRSLPDSPSVDFASDRL
jgi:hypothetical protein